MPTFAYRIAVIAMLSAAITAGCTTTATSTPGNAASAAQTAQSPPPIDPAFVTRANSACVPYKKWNDTHPNGVPIAGFNVNHPDPRILVQAADWFDKVPLYHTFTPTIAALGQPTTGIQSWTALTNEVDRLQQDWTVQIEAARRGDAATWTKQFNDEGILTAQISLDLTKLGFTADEPCAQLFG